MEAGLRQGDLAARMGRPQGYVSRYETGEQPLGFVEVDLICRAIGLPLEELVRRYEEGVPWGSGAIGPADDGPGRTNGTLLNTER